MSTNSLVGKAKVAVAIQLKTFEILCLKHLLDSHALLPSFFYPEMKRIVQQCYKEWLTGESEPNYKLMDDHQCNSTTMSKSILNITLIVPVKITQSIQNAVQYPIPNLKCAEYTTIFVL